MSKFAGKVGMKKAGFNIILIVLCSLELRAGLVNIGILERYNIQRFSFTAEKGRYLLFADNNKIGEIGPGEILFLSSKSRKVDLKSTVKYYGNFEKIFLVGTEKENVFRIAPIEPERNIRSYDDNLKVVNTGLALRLVNNIDLENYIAGVVQAEVGPNPAREFFKLQAILCRTYALENLNKHEFEGFNLCDRVHCQAYHKRCDDSDIRNSSRMTKGLVIVDSDINLITAAFYSNCGGQTVNSEDVWQKPVYYLRSVKDPYCKHEPNSRWTKKIPKGEWLSYLRRKANGSMAATTMDLRPFYQDQRCAYYPFGDVRIPLKTIRSDWKLKSTFFDVIPDGEYIDLQGRGFGHGSGLCQEGAMKMASSGFSYPDILHFYYKNVHLVDLSVIGFFKDE